MKNDSSKAAMQGTGVPALAVPLTETVASKALKPAASEIEMRMLVIRLSNAATRIREEASLIQRTGFSDQNSRLLRMLGETVEEQRLALETVGGDAK